MRCDAIFHSQWFKFHEETIAYISSRLALLFTRTVAAHVDQITLRMSAISFLWQQIQPCTSSNLWDIDYGIKTSRGQSNTTVCLFWLSPRHCMEFSYMPRQIIPATVSYLGSAVRTDQGLPSDAHLLCKKRVCNPNVVRHIFLFRLPFRTLRALNKFKMITSMFPNRVSIYHTD